MSMTLSEELQWRGFYNQATFQDPAELDNKPFTLYLGADPTADSLHVGHLAVYMMVRRFLDHGHKVVLLVGGGTGIIGDPSGKSEERNLQTLEQVAKNKQALEKQVSILFSGHPFELVDNYNWLKDVSILEFLRDTGKHFSISNLIQRDYIADRIGEGGSGMSYTEFSYTLLQGYDFWHLFCTNSVNLQVGGSDQWGNILSGVDLIRKRESEVVHGMTAPLIINKKTGKKFGKSEGGAVWLDESKTSVYQFYQFWLNTDDDGVIDYLKLFTLLDKKTIESVADQSKANPAQRVAQKTLAYEVTKLVHGDSRANDVKQASEVLFGQGNFLELDNKAIEMLKGELSTVSAEDTLPKTLVSAGLASSNSEAMRFISSGAISINGNKLDNSENVQLQQGANLVKRGKNSFAIVEQK